MSGDTTDTSRPNVYGLILEWSQKLPGWQRDALRRIIVTSCIGDGDVADLVALAKHESGTPAESGAPVPIPLAREHLNVGHVAKERVVLDAIGQVQNVNALAPGQRLAFARSGLTVVYGENGSGKSGYVRVLRRVCRARRAPDILPDARVANPGKPQAVFWIRKGDTDAVPVAWTQGEDPPEELGSLSVFDRESEKSFVDEDDESTFVPVGLDVFEELASVVSKVREALVLEERLQLPSDDLSDVRLAVSGFTEASAYLAALVPRQSPDVYDGLLQKLLKLTGGHDFRHYGRVDNLVISAVCAVLGAA